MMNILNLYVRLYGALYNRRGVHYRILSPIRYLVRRLANRHIPVYLSKPFYNKERNVINGLVVSLTSFPARIEKVWMVVECMKRQTVLPEKIILWLSKQQFPSRETVPTSLWNRVDDIFEIRFVDDDIKSHKKYYYACKEHRDDLIFLIDDDIFYPFNIIECTYRIYLQHKDSVICNYACRIVYDKNGQHKRYSEWKNVFGGAEGNDLFFGSGGGTLFKPSQLHKDLTSIDAALALTPLADDIWLNAMVKLMGTNIVKLKSGLVLPILSGSEDLSDRNVGMSYNDIQLERIEEHYKRCFDKDLVSIINS